MKPNKFYHDNFDLFENEAIHLRNASMVCELCLFVKSFYFMSQIEWLAPIIDQINHMLKKIVPYVFVMGMFGLIFSNFFIQMGKSQLQFDGISKGGEVEGINYADALKSYFFIYYMLIAEPEYDMFNFGEASFSWPLFVLFICTTFFMQIFLLNMLIAIMN